MCHGVNGAGQYATSLVTKNRTSLAVIVHRIMKACRVARRLAVENFHSVEVTSACLVFISLLGQDTSLLRLHLQVANQLVEHSTNQIAVTTPTDQSAGDDDPVASTKIRECIVLTADRYFMVIET